MVYETAGGKQYCEQCDKYFKQIGKHYSKSNCDWPDISTVEMEAIKGLLMGDGTITEGGCMQVSMINKNFIRWLSKKFGWLCCEPREYTSTTGGVDSEMCRVSFRTHPNIKSLRSWYESGEKRWPDERLTPTKLLFFYISDGSFNCGETHRYIRISICNEKDRLEWVGEMFTNIDMENPRVQYNGVSPSGVESYSIVFKVRGTKKLFEYMSRSPMFDGVVNTFQYKFPEEYGGTGKSMSDVDIA